MIKRFKKIVNFPDYYINCKGNIWSTKSHKYIHPCMGHGYLQIKLCRDNKVYCRRVHRLLLETFISLCPEGMQACHNNGNKLDNRLENLRWDTAKNNIADAIKHGTHNCISKMKLREKDVINIIHLWNTKLFRQREIAKMYNIKSNTVWNKLVRKIKMKSWKQILRDKPQEEF